MTNKHFENLWEECEQFHHTTQAENNPLENMMKELSMKADLYQVIESRTELSPEDRQQAKSRILGEILLNISLLSLKDNINVYEALATALQYRRIGSFIK